MHNNLDASTWGYGTLARGMRWISELLFGTATNPAHPFPDPTAFRRDRRFDGCQRFVPLASLAALAVGAITPALQDTEEASLLHGELPIVTLRLNGTAPTIATTDTASRHRLAAYRALGATHVRCKVVHT